MENWKVSMVSSLGVKMGEVGLFFIIFQNRNFDRDEYFMKKRGYARNILRERERLKLIFILNQDI